MPYEHGRGLMGPKGGLLYCRLSIQLEGPLVAESSKSEACTPEGPCAMMHDAAVSLTNTCIGHHRDWLLIRGRLSLLIGSGSDWEGKVCNREREREQPSGSWG